MPSYTVFTSAESGNPLASLQVLDQAFAMACAEAGFVPKWSRTGRQTTVIYLDARAKGRELPPRSAEHADAFEARRAVMTAALAEGIWGVFAVPDADYRAEMRKSADIAQAHRRTLQAELRKPVVPITVLRDNGLPLARFDGEAIWRGKPDAQG